MYQPNKKFGLNGYEKQAYSIDFWIDPVSNPAGTETLDDDEFLDQGHSNFVYRDRESIIAQFTGTNWKDNVFLQYPFFDEFEAKFIGISWNTDSAQLWINGELVDEAIVPSGFTFVNTDPQIWLSPFGSVSHFTVYDHQLDPEVYKEKWNLRNDILSHADAMFKDGGQVFEMWIPKSYVTDIVLDRELAGKDSIGAAKDRNGFWTQRPVDNLTEYPSAGLAYSSPNGLTCYNDVWLKQPVGSLFGTNQFVISMTAIDVTLTPATKYLWSLESPNQTFEVWLDSSYVMHVTDTKYAVDGTVTTNTYAYDTAITITNSALTQLVFIYDNGKFYAWTGQVTPYTFNNVSAVDHIAVDINITKDMNFVFGRSADETVIGYDVLGNLFIHNRLLPDSYIGGVYSGYADEFYAAGYWPLWNNNTAANRALLTCYPYIATTDSVKSAYLLSKRSAGAYTFLTNTNGSQTIHRNCAPINTTLIPDNSVAGTGFPNQFSDFSNRLDGTTTMFRYGQKMVALKDQTIRLFHDLRANALHDAAYIQFEGAGRMYLPTEPKSTLNHDKYAGAFFEAGNTWGGTVIDPNVDGITVHYDYRSFEFLFYVDDEIAPAVSGSYPFIAITNGTTEYYFSWKYDFTYDTNFTNVLINGSTPGGTALNGLINQWNHVYVEIPTANITDHQLYIGRNVANTVHAEGMGIRNLATYNRVLTAAEKQEHYGAFLGKYRGTTDVVDSIWYAENKAPLLYQPNWATVVVPVS